MTGNRRVKRWFLFERKNPMTLDEMAKSLGVSKSTVSRALSGKGRIGGETRERIQEFARQQNGNPGKEKEKAGATRNLGVILPVDVYSNGGPYFQECILGICETATFLDYDVLIATGSANDVYGMPFSQKRETLQRNMRYTKRLSESIRRFPK